jgi:isocitrate/isopropylmalate dehydrogenase
VITALKKQRPKVKTSTIASAGRLLILQVRTYDMGGKDSTLDVAKAIADYAS